MRLKRDFYVPLFACYNIFKASEKKEEEVEDKFIQAAVNNFKNGFSCSESIAKAAVDLKLADENLINIATSFSGGMSSGCLCGAVAGSQMIIGYLFGKNKTNTARALAKEFLDEFKNTHKAACCKVLTHNIEFGSPERKAHCTNIVANCAKILYKIMERETSKV